MSVKIKNKQVIVTDTFNFNNNKISNLAIPTLSTDAVNVAYLTNNYLPLSGGTVNGDVTINGNFYVSGTTTTVDVDNMNVTDNYVLLNSGEAGSSVSVGSAGVEIDRGSGTNYSFYFDDADDKFKAGFVGNGREVVLYDASSNLTITGGTLTLIDTNTQIYEDGSNNLTFKDAIAGTFTLDDITSLTLSGDISASGEVGDPIVTTLGPTAITGKGEITAGLQSTDELLLSDAGTLKRMDISVIEAYMQSNLSLSINTLIAGEGIFGDDFSGTTDTQWSIRISEFGAELLSGLVSTDEFIINDGGTTKRMDVSVLTTYMQDNLTFTTNTNTYVNGASFNTNTGLLTLTRAGDFSSVVTVDLDNRYALTSASGTLTSVSAGAGMTFSDITSTGDVILGTPSILDSGTTNSVSTGTHAHEIDSASFVTGDDGILVNGNGQFILDDSYLEEKTLPGLFSYTGVTADRELGILPSGQTMGMVYITNNGTATALVDLGTTSTGNEITSYTQIEVAPGEEISVTVNIRLSSTQSKTIYINSSSWTDVDLDVEWAKITYQNAATTLSPGDLPIASAVSLGAIKVGSGLSIDVDGVLSSAAALNGLSDVTISSPSTNEVLVYDGSGWVNSGITSTGGGSGGFLGTVTEGDPEPLNLTNNQWVKPAPKTDGTYEYTFTYFLDVSSIGISVNLSEEDVYLKYYEAGDYWIKESYNKPLGEGMAWVGNANDEAKEIQTIDEWATTETLTDIGEKHYQQVQTLMKVSATNTAITQNFVFIKDIDLTTVGNTLLVSSISGKKILIKNIKLIILDTANPTSFTVNVGNNPSSYNNVVSSENIQDVIVDEYYNLTIDPNPTGSDGAIIDISSIGLYFRVETASTAGTLNCHILLEGLVF